LTGSFNKLTQAQNKFYACSIALQDVEQKGAGAEVLVPLTSSLYVPGEIEQTQKVLLDIGTGYFVEKVSRCFCLLCCWQSIIVCMPVDACVSADLDAVRHLPSSEWLDFSFTQYGCMTLLLFLEHSRCAGLLQAHDGVSAGQPGPAEADDYGATKQQKE
jgi:hypothetical protein